ncbi:MAG: hypothetical protein VR72_09605 [Clostridiaceae bacterium BRH_c20a]|nr:MAG: hypothetical protein VR72_09605 [Clostridiaceae bacterium BRH_c20a]
MDRFKAGVIAGLVGALFMNIWSFTTYYIFKINNLLYLDWASIMIFRHKPNLGLRPYLNEHFN